MASAFVVSMGVRFAIDTTTPRGFAMNLIITTGVTTIVWIAVTLMTKPEPAETLQRFYLKVRPAGPGWAPVARATGVEPPRGEIGRNFVLWIAGIVFVYSIMFATGSILFHERVAAITYVVALVVSGVVLFAALDTDS